MVGVDVVVGVLVEDEAKGIAGGDGGKVGVAEDGSVVLELAVVALGEEEGGGLEVELVAEEGEGGVVVGGDAGGELGVALVALLVGEPHGGGEEEGAAVVGGGGDGGGAVVGFAGKLPVGVEEHVAEVGDEEDFGGALGDGAGDDAHNGAPAVAGEEVADFEVGGAVGVLEGHEDRALGEGAVVEVEVADVGEGNGLVAGGAEGGQVLAEALGGDEGAGGFGDGGDAFVGDGEEAPGGAVDGGGGLFEGAVVDAPVGALDDGPEGHEQADEGQEEQPAADAVGLGDGDGTGPLRRVLRGRRLGRGRRGDGRAVVGTVVVVLVRCVHPRVPHFLPLRVKRAQ